MDSSEIKNRPVNGQTITMSHDNYLNDSNNNNNNNSSTNQSVVNFSPAESKTLLTNGQQFKHHNGEKDFLANKTYIDDIIDEETVRMAKRRVFSFLTMKSLVGFFLVYIASQTKEKNIKSAGIYVFWIAYIVLTLALSLATWCKWIRCRRWALLLCLLVTIKMMTSMMWLPAINNYHGHKIAITTLLKFAIYSFGFSLLTYVKTLRPTLRNDIILIVSMNLITLKLAVPFKLYYLFPGVIALYMVVMFYHVLKTADRGIILRGNFLQHIVYMILPVPIIVFYPILNSFIDKLLDLQP